MKRAPIAVLACLIPLAIAAVVVGCAPVQVGPKELPTILPKAAKRSDARCPTPPPLPATVHLNVEPGIRLEPGDVDAGGRLMLEWWSCLRHPGRKCPRS